MPQHSYKTGIINFRKMIKDEENVDHARDKTTEKKTEENYNMKSTCE